jgi:hypothetical protein
MSTGICTERTGSGVLPDTRAFPDPAGQLTGTVRVSDSERERAGDVLSKAFAGAALALAMVGPVLAALFVLL